MRVHFGVSMGMDQFLVLVVVVTLVMIGLTYMIVRRQGR